MRGLGEGSQGGTRAGHTGGQLVTRAGKPAIHEGKGARVGQGLVTQEDGWSHGQASQLFTKGWDEGWSHGHGGKGERRAN